MKTYENEFGNRLENTGAKKKPQDYQNHHQDQQKQNERQNKIKKEIPDVQGCIPIDVMGKYGMRFKTIPLMGLLKLTNKDDKDLLSCFLQHMRF